MDKNIEKETFYLEFTIKKLKKKLEDRRVSHRQAGYK
jgi:hypothetical protein